jgi:hypothetical protein
MTQGIFEEGQAGSKQMNTRPRLCGEEYSARSRRRWFVHPCEEQ